MSGETLAASGVEDLFRASGALLEGHFLLTSGLHSPRYMQCSQVLKSPPLAEEVCRRLAALVEPRPLAAVVGPALGGIIVAYELARALKTAALFTERRDGKMGLHRGFTLQPGDRVLVAEDVVTTGGSASEVLENVRALGAVPVAVAALVCRGKPDFGLPFYRLFDWSPPTFNAASCPLCREGRPLVKPGSRTPPAPAAG